jgi:asparagine synthetase B (glutamine-hydrolysing)
MDLINALTYPIILPENFLPDELFDLAFQKRDLPQGHFAFAWGNAGEVRMVRDPLGLNKLFWSETGEGQVVVSSRIDYLLDRQISLDRIRSVPPGRAVSIQPGSPSVTQGVDIASNEMKASFDLSSFQTTVRVKLEDYFDFIGERFKGSTFVVCLSGGLDSTLITCLAAKRIPGLMATCFTYISDEGFKRWLSGCPVQDLPCVSDDFRTAFQIAQKLDIPLLPVLRSKASVASQVSNVVRLCQDWRDFNVHCAVVNLFIAQQLRCEFPSRPIVVLTGDLMNELVCDYREEFVGGEMYYRQPQVPLSVKRRFFVRGLDAGDREIGVFNAFDLTLAQPFAVVAREYMEIPSNILEEPDAKMYLNGGLISPEVLQMVSHVKQRAQVGGVDGGTLAVFHRLGLRQEDLYRLWVRGVRESLRGSDPSDLIQFGRYRTTVKGG